ncbi:MAG: molecular chaperone DnaJ [Parvibaculum sp.]|nr:molecular chaperone DnaJ [Parvibaculum sp.]|tara:strand:+ start:1368 stop:2084 length:717 start_codon:yes stop_codon:yes gene_type:complete
MSAFLLAVALLLGFVVILQLATRADPKSLAKVIRYVGIGVSGLLGLVLLLTGRFGFAVPVFMFCFWLMGRRLPIPGMSGGFSGGFGGGPKTPGQASDIETAFLSMSLDHDSGEMEGKVLQGRFVGTRLGDLNLSDLYQLLKEVSVDADSARLLEAYLDRYVGRDWRADAGQAGAQKTSSFGAMTREEAYDVLGLRPGATADAIRKAHKDLMLKLHPDHGGSTQLAARVNAAKDLLLGD